MENIMHSIEDDVSPATSPQRDLSPPTSPVALPLGLLTPSPQRNLSPPTSPTEHVAWPLGESSSSSSDGTPPAKHPKRPVARSTTMRRSLHRENQGEESSSNSGSENHRNMVVSDGASDNEDQRRFVDDSSRLQGSENLYVSNTSQLIEDQNATNSNISDTAGELSGMESSDSALSNVFSADSSVRSISTASSLNLSDVSGENLEGSDFGSIVVDGDSDEDENNQRNMFLFEGSNLETNKALYDVLKLYISERWTKTSLDKNLKLIKKMLPKPNNLPSTSKDAFKKLKELTSFYNKEENYFYCSECGESVLHSDDTCNNCGCREIGVFYSFPVDAQLKHMFEHRGLSSVIDYYREHNQQKEDYICDIQDGSEYQNLKQYLVNQYDIVLAWNTDGVNLSSSSKQELWGILCTICEVPPKLRASFMIVCGVYVDKKKPNMNVFLKPFVDSLQNIYQNDGVLWIHPESKSVHKSIVLAPILVADAPAKAITLNVKQYNAKYGCNICEQKSEKITVDVNQVLQGVRRPKTKRRFVFSETNARLRTGLRMNQQGVLAERRGSPRKGVNGKSITSNIPCFDRAACVAAEYLHTVALGCTKYFLNLIFFVNQGPWFIGNQINEIEKFISQNIKVPNFIKRLPRSISEFKYFKASELRAFLLYYSLPIFEGRLPAEYFQHWMLFVAAMHILLSDEISSQDLSAAEILLRCFVRDVKSLYGSQYYTYNVHNLTHLTLLVKRWGPLWATSAFIYEKYNGFITDHVHGTKHLGKELLNNIQIMQAVVVLGDIINAPTNHLPLFLAPAESQPIQLLGKPYNADLNSVEKEALINAQLGATVFFKRVTLNSEIYSCKLYDATKKRTNSLVKFLDGNSLERYGEILHFIKAENNSVHCLLSVYKIVHVKIFFHEESRFHVPNFVPVDESQMLLVIPVESIVRKVLKVGRYLCNTPNSYEINL